ncbi:MAG: NAD(P)/FAD-dependent oxidoreductase, partial [Candidatus Omnitrophica bacterium]|nr:NAD(P)/FAD-dependent oxidoreductase [Candidatus Omnitrophota bacterium]
KLGKKVCLIEKDELGGTCLNRGCIPTKVLTHSSKNICKDSSPGINSIRKEQAEVISKLKQGIEFLVKSQKIDFIKGAARIISPSKVSINEGKSEIEAKFILICSGSGPKDLPFLKFDHKKILSSDDMLKLDSLPDSLLIVGGGVIGCEFACALNRLGVKVTIAELMDRLIFMFDKDISQKLEQAFKKSGISVNTNYNVKDKDLSQYEKILLCVGRGLNLSGLLDSKIALKLDDNSFIKVDSRLKTSIDNIYAAGDCVGSLQLAHVASYEGRLAVNNMFGKPKDADYSVVPSSVFTSPEVAQVGLNEAAAKSQNKNIKIIKKFFLSVGMAHIIKETDGFIKLIIDIDTGAVLGAGIIGLYATELINTLTMAVKYRLTAESLSDLIFAHPSISEIFTESIQS